MSELSKFIEHTLLKPGTSLAEVRQLCADAQKHGFYGVCIPPLYVRDARRLLGEDGAIRVITVIGFPMGYTSIPAKSEEIRRALEEGADEVDVVINLAAVKSENWNHVNHDIDSVARATHMRGRTLKLILECGLLNEAEMRQVNGYAEEARVTWLKTGTGFHGFPATVEMVRKLRAIAPAGMKIKAAGGITTAKDAQALLDAGADRIGTSASLAIIGEKNA
ncbi:MAG: deoxyribose-phosphate aldolase [Saprospiraceae bacterium]